MLYELLSLKLAYRLGPIDNWPQPDFGYSPLFSIILKRFSLNIKNYLYLENQIIYVIFKECSKETEKNESSRMIYIFAYW